MGCLTNFLWAKWVIGLGVDLWESVWTFCEVQRPPNIRDFQVRWYFERTFFYPIMWDTQCHEPTIWGWLESAPFTVNVGRCFLGFSPLLHPFWKWHGYLKWRYISYMYWFEVCTHIMHISCRNALSQSNLAAAKSPKITANHHPMPFSRWNGATTWKHPSLSFFACWCLVSNRYLMGQDFWYMFF
jgi:hypothetical protein